MNNQAITAIQFSTPFIYSKDTVWSLLETNQTVHPLVKVETFLKREFGERLTTHVLSTYHTKSDIVSKDELQSLLVGVSVDVRKEDLSKERPLEKFRRDPNGRSLVELFKTPLVDNYELKTLSIIDSLNLWNPNTKSGSPLVKSLMMPEFLARKVGYQLRHYLENSSKSPQELISLRKGLLFNLYVGDKQRLFEVKEIMISNGMICQFIMPAIVDINDSSIPLFVLFQGTITSLTSVSRDNPLAPGYDFWQAKESDQLIETFEAIVKQFPNCSFEVICTGHSLGGSDAQNFGAKWLEKNSQIIPQISSFQVITFQTAGIPDETETKFQQALSTPKKRFIKRPIHCVVIGDFVNHSGATKIGTTCNAIFIELEPLTNLKSLDCHTIYFFVNDISEHNLRVIEEPQSEAYQFHSSGLDEHILVLGNKLINIFNRTKEKSMNPVKQNLQVIKEYQKTNCSLFVNDQGQLNYSTLFWSPSVEDQNKVYKVILCCVDHLEASSADTRKRENITKIAIEFLNGLNRMTVDYKSYVIYNKLKNLHTRLSNFCFQLESASRNRLEALYHENRITHPLNLLKTTSEKFLIEKVKGVFTRFYNQDIADYVIENTPGKGKEINRDQLIFGVRLAESCIQKTLEVENEKLRKQLEHLKKQGKPKPQKEECAEKKALFSSIRNFKEPLRKVEKQPKKNSENSEDLISVLSTAFAKMFNRAYPEEGSDDES